MCIACEKCTQRERIIGELEDENKRLGAKVVMLKDNLITLSDTILMYKTSHSVLKGSVDDGY